MNTTLRVSAAMSGLAALLLCTQLPAAEPPGADRGAAPAPQAPAALTGSPEAKQPVAVAIYEFRSSIPEIPARGATDMFITALVHNGRFTVVERSQLNQSVLLEKQLNSQKLSTGDSASQQLRGAQYLFEGTISEGTAAENQRAGSVGLAGVSVGGGANRDEIAIDVRVIEAATGRIVDSLSVRKSLKSSSANVSGIGGLLSKVLHRGTGSDYSSSSFGTYLPDTPNVSLSRQRKDSLDQTLREMINEAVSELAAKLP